MFTFWSFSERMKASSRRRRNPFRPMTCNEKSGYSSSTLKARSTQELWPSSQYLLSCSLLWSSASRPCPSSSTTRFLTRRLMGQKLKKTKFLTSLTPSSLLKRCVSSGSLSSFWSVFDKITKMQKHVLRILYMDRLCGRWKVVGWNYFIHRYLNSTKLNMILMVHS